MVSKSVMAKGLCERIGIDGSKLTHEPIEKKKYILETPMPTHQEAVKIVMDALVNPEHGVISNIKEVAAVGHRVLHGGSTYSDSIIVNEDVKKVIRECFDLGPLHNPANLMGIEACEAAMPGTPNVAVFDTAFGQGMEPDAYLYAIPHEYYDKYNIRRYGFHGTSHKYVSGRTIEFGRLPVYSRRVIVCHLGNGGSISASMNGKCVDTSMGLTPLEGLIMGTRSGDVDPAVVQYIMNKEGKTIDEMLNILNKESGMLGMSGVSSDFRDVTAAEEAGNLNAKAANAAFRHRLIKYIGGYIALMNGVDAITFTGGLGENDGDMRQMVCDSLGYLGVELDKEKNQIRGQEIMISSPDSKVKVYVIPTNEELAIARETLELTK